VNRALTIALGILLAALCGVCVWQWKREADFRAAIADFAGKLGREQEAHDQSSQRLTVLEAEIARLTRLRDDTEAKYLATLTELRAIQPDWIARGHSLTALSQIAAAAPAAASQNAAITRQNELLKQLTTERDSAIEKLNARTREFNSLTEKYNKLAGGR
jgi:chromosome segregation ATPase